jgi:hypothetical protein
VGEAHVELRLLRRDGAGSLLRRELEVMRTEAQLSISRFYELAGIHRSTYHRWAAPGRRYPRAPPHYDRANMSHFLDAGQSPLIPIGELGRLCGSSALGWWSSRSWPPVGRRGYRSDSG